MNRDASGPATTAGGWWSQRNRILGVLVLVYACQIVDRQLPGILLPMIKADLQLTDTELGILTGPAFAIVFVVFGLPVAWLADRSSRRLIVAVAVSAWSVMTAATAFAQGLWSMMALRIGVGVGEAGCGPVSHAIIAEHFAPAERGSAMGVYYWGSSLGTLIAFMGGGWVGEVFGWRVAFLAAGLPGIALAVMVYRTIPASSHGRPSRPEAPDTMSLGAALKFLAGQRSFVFLAIAAAFSNMAYAGGLGWIPSFFNRSHQLGSAEIGLWLSLSTGVIATGGLFLGGWLADKASRRDLLWYMWLPGVGMAIALPTLFAVFLVGNANLAFALFALAWLGAAIGIAPNYALAQTLAQSRMRAMASAALAFCVSSMGYGVGPLLIGALSDAWQPTFGDQSLRYALLAVMASGTSVAALAFLFGGETVARDAERAVATEAASTQS